MHHARVQREIPETYRIARERGVGIAVTGFSRAALIRLIDFPELPLRIGRCEAVKAGRSSLVVKTDFPFDTGNVAVAYKRLRRKNWWKAVTGSLRTHRALRAWKLGHALMDRGIDTPRPLAVILPPKRRITADAFLATEWIDGSVTLSEFLHSTEFFAVHERQQRLVSAAVGLGRLFGRMHAAGVRHRDLKPSNLLLVPAEFGLRVLLVDLDGAAVNRRVSRRVRCRNLARVLIGTESEPTVTTTLRLRGLLAYLSASGESASDWKPFWRQLQHVAEIRSARKKRRAAA